MRKPDPSISTDSAAISPRRGPACLIQSAMFGLILLAHSSHLIQARVLNDEDFRKLSSIKTSFAEVVTNISQLSKRPDLASQDADCMNSVLRDLLQISEELKSYEYLITIENQLTDVDDDADLKHIVRFAVGKALEVLEIERNRLTQLSEPCSRRPLSASKVQEAIVFVEGTVAILRSLQPRL
jgi:hypothetical protein